MSDSESESEQENFFHENGFVESDFENELTSDDACISEEEINGDEKNIEQHDPNTNVFTQYGDFSRQSHDNFMKEELIRQKKDRERRQETFQQRMDRRRTANTRFYKFLEENKKRTRERQAKRKKKEEKEINEQHRSNPDSRYKDFEIVNIGVLLTFLSEEDNYNGREVHIQDFKRLMLLHPRTSIRKTLKTYKTTILKFHPDKFSGTSQNISMALTQILNNGKANIGLKK
jgi:hypothetical protein